MRLQSQKTELKWDGKKRRKLNTEVVGKKQDIEYLVEGHKILLRGLCRETFLKTNIFTFSGLTKDNHEENCCQESLVSETFQAHFSGVGLQNAVVPLVVTDIIVFLST
jgi:hypothetical protein